MMKKTKADPVRDERLRAMIVAGAQAEATRLQRLIDEAGRDMPVSALAGPDEEFVIRVARVDWSVLLTSTIRHDASFLLFTGGGLLADVMSIGSEWGPWIGVQTGPLLGHDGKRPTGWSWSGLRSPVGRVG